MANDFFVGAARPVTLRNWKPKCNAEREKRLLLEFELALTTELVEVAPHQVKRMHDIVSVGENGMAIAPIETEFGPLSVEVFNTPDDVRPRFTLTGATIRSVVVFRSTAPATGPGETFVKFSIHTGIANSEQVSWALDAMKATSFLVFHPTQQADLDFKEKEAEATKTTKKDHKKAAAGDTE